MTDGQFEAWFNSCREAQSKRQKHDELQKTISELQAKKDEISLLESRVADLKKELEGG